MTWANNHDASLERLRQVQGSLTVDLIMVARDDFLTCTIADTAVDVKARNVDDFSFIPVIDEQGRVIGLYNAERWFGTEAPSAPVGDDYARLSEDIVIGADATILDFIVQADTNPTNLVISGSSIAGLVSLSDIQQLPVRAALFAAITSLEMAMALAIETRWPKADDWIDLMSTNRREQLSDQVTKARHTDGFVNEIAFSQFSDKAGLVCKGRLLERSNTSLMKDFKAIRELRDDLAHANIYADTPEAAKRVCGIVRSIYQLKDELLEFIEKSSPTS